MLKIEFKTCQKHLAVLFNFATAGGNWRKAYFKDPKV